MYNKTTKGTFLYFLNQNNIKFSKSMALKVKNHINDVIGPAVNEKWHLFLINKESELPFQIENIGITYPNPRYHVERQDSKLFVFEYVVSGKGHLIFDDQEFELVPGDFYIIEPHQAHIDCCNKDDPYEKIWVNFSSDCFQQVFNAYHLNGIHVFKNLNMRPYFDQLLLISERSNHSDDISIDVSNIVFEMLHIIAKQKSNPSSKISPTAQLIKNALDNAAFKEISMDELMKSIHYSKKQINRIFKKEFNQTPYDYYLDVKLGFAKRYLAMTDLSINEISQKLHFNNQYYFSNLFKKKIGMSPLKYRNSKRVK